MSTLLTKTEVLEVSGGGLSLGQIVSVLAIGIVTGGPAGLGIAASGLVMAHGINNRDDLVHNQ